MRRLVRRCSSSFVDTHCQLDQIYELRKAARPESETKFEMIDKFSPQLDACITVGNNPDTLDEVVSYLAHDKVFGAFGIHPFQAERWESNQGVQEKFKKLLTHKKCVAVGGCGLHFGDKITGRPLPQSLQEVQKQVFTEQVKMAIEFNKPLVVYDRKAPEETFEILSKNLPQDYLIHMHSFTGFIGHSNRLLNHFSNIYFSFSGGVTFSNAVALRVVAASIPQSRLLLESDGPLLAPEPFRRGIAIPDHALTIAKFLSQLRGTSLEHCLDLCRKNTQRFYGI